MNFIKRLCLRRYKLDQIKIKVDGIYFFTSSRQCLYKHLSLYPEFRNEIIELSYKQDKNHLLFSGLENDLKSLIGLIEIIPEYKPYLCEYLLNKPPLNQIPESFLSLNEIQKREDLIDQYLELFPDLKVDLLSKKASIEILFENPPGNIEELFWLIKKFPERGEECIKKSLNEQFNTVFSNFDSIILFIEKFPKYKELIGRKLFQELPSSYLYSLITKKFDLQKVLTHFSLHKETLFSFIMNNNECFYNDNINFLEFVRLFPEFKIEILDKAFGDPENFQWFANNARQLEIYCEKFGAEMIPYLRQMFKFPLLWRRYFLNESVLAHLCKSLPTFSSSLISLAVSNEILYKKIFRGAFELQYFIENLPLTKSDTDQLVSRAIELNEPVKFFEKSPFYFLRFSRAFPEIMEKLIQKLLKNDEDFFSFFSYFDVFVDCIKIFPNYKDRLLRKLMKDEEKFKQIMGRSYHGYAKYEDNIKFAARIFPEYTLFKASNPEEKIRESREQLEAWIKVSQSTRNQFSNSLSPRTIHLVGLFAANPEVYSAETASETIQELSKKL